MGSFYDWLVKMLHMRINYNSSFQHQMINKREFGGDVLAGFRFQFLDVLAERPHALEDPGVKSSGPHLHVRGRARPVGGQDRMAGESIAAWALKPNSKVPASTNREATGFLRNRDLLNLVSPDFEPRHRHRD